MASFQGKKPHDGNYPDANRLFGNYPKEKESRPAAPGPSYTGARPKSFQAAGSGRLSKPFLQQNSTGNTGRGRGYSFQGPKSAYSWKARGQQDGNQQALRNEHQRKGPLNFTNLKKLAEVTTEPAEIVRKLANTDHGLKKLLSENPNKWDVHELVLVALGGFCERNGVASFSSDFIAMVRILAEHEVFRNVANVIIQISTAQVSLHPTKEERMKGLIKSIFHLGIEMLVLMPAFACNCLGQNFFTDVYALKDIPSVRALNQSSAFELLHEASSRLQNAWEQHGTTSEDLTVAQKNTEEQKSAKRQQEEELVNLLRPPDDFRRLSIVPGIKDLCSDEEPFLRPNLVVGKYPNVDTYLDVQFRLVREDFFGPLRQGLKDYKVATEGRAPSSHRRIRVDNIRLYQNAKIVKQETGRNGEITYTLQFSVQGLQRIKWDQSKRLIFGSLLLLSADNFDTFLLFTVADRKTEKLAQGQLTVRFEGSILPAYVWKQPMVMAESSVFFESYRSVLVALQRFSPVHFPMKDYILGQSVAHAVPDYLTDKEAVYDLASVPMVFSKQLELRFSRTPRIMGRRYATATNIFDRVEGEAIAGPTQTLQQNTAVELKRVAILDENRRPGADALNLDPSQAEALFAALTQKLAVIQGPPGTGKTYLGLKIVKTLLDNKQYWSPDGSSPAPILVICYTNHALDQFLEGIMKYTNKIVRIGGQSKCDAMIQFGLREWKKRAIQQGLGRNYRSWHGETRAQYSYLREALESRRRDLKAAEASGVIDEDTLLLIEVISKGLHSKLTSMRTHFQWYSPDASVLPLWLGLGSADILDALVRDLPRKVPGAIQPPPATNKVAVNPAVEDDRDDEWDQEDIDNLQRERLVDDDEVEEEAVDAIKKEPEERKVTVQGAVHFAFLAENLRKEIENRKAEKVYLEDEDLEWANWNIAEMEFRLDAILKLLSAPFVRPDIDMEHINDPMRIPYLQRWKIYTSWKYRAVGLLEEEVSMLEAECRAQANKVKDVETLETAELIRGADIVGITTTGAARQRALLEPLKSKIVVVEEAAEVLEAHITTALSSSCQHLILIGDHQQLRPSTTVYDLARKYHLDISLFERLIMNGMKPCVLGVQHRMRPEVARLIVPSIYPQLENHESVTRYPNVPGMRRNVFFLTHSEPEQGDRSDQESRSHLNPFEAELALALAHHLLRQGLKPERITILTTYAGQLLHMLKMRRNQATLQGVRIAVVDNFQGEENDVIILSLVRSNQEAKIGFLKTPNRICVALSRAKMGFFMIGNMENLEQSKLWSQIKQTLEPNGELGHRFELQCGVHPDVIMNAYEPKDFPPEGGCFAKCLKAMPCGHVCPRMCHAEDQEHAHQKCTQACTRSCKEGHPCSKKCFQDCNPCMTKVSKMLPCTHSGTTFCSIEPEKVYCTTKLIKTLPICGHRQEMDCGKLPETAKCVENCGMPLRCGHQCDLVCHKKSSHDGFRCPKPCRRTCSEGHPCLKRCSDDCGNCLVKMIKKLPCGHEMEMECWKPAQDAFCNVKMEKNLNDCQHTAVMCCSQTTEGFKCPLPCEKQLCADGHPCKKLCWEACGVCNVKMERELSCGHRLTLQCHLDPKKIKCKVPKQVVLPDCGHKVKIPCGEKLDEARCTLPCDVRLECGHRCTERCHTKDDPDHKNYLCKKPCGRTKANCKENHKCGRKCHEECTTCRVKTNRLLPCNHMVFAECGLKDEDIFCKEMVKKVIPECGHEVELMCSIVPSRALCKQPCSLELDCGHRCRKRCCDQCSTADCVEPVTTDIVSLCGHRMILRCQDPFRRSPGTMTEARKVEYLQQCPQPCAALLKPCEHPCKGKCCDCFNGRLHKACEEKCGRPLVCGHNCDVTCAASCPPCQKVCEYRCQHSRCRKKCCEPCSNCLEPCEWKCAHYQCTRNCGEKCDRPRCNEPCSKVIESCGHPCIGLCGEVCPPLCRICDKDKLTEFILSGNEEEEDARFVYLEDCGHCIEVEGMDRWMTMSPTEEEGSASEIQMKRCPVCKTLIVSCLRYNDVIKGHFQDVVKVKRKLLSSHSNPKEFAEKLTGKITKMTMYMNSKLLPAEVKQHFIYSLMSNSMGEIRKKVTPRKGGRWNQITFPCLTNEDRYLLQVQVDLLERVLDVLKNVSTTVETHGVMYGQRTRTSLKPELLGDILNRLKRLVSSLLDRQRSTDEEYQAYIREVERLDLVRAFFLLQSSPSYRVGNPLADEEVGRLQVNLMKSVKPLTEADKAEVKKILSSLGERLNTGLGISDVERQEIVKAIGLSQGHWFKCPNGHVYAIGDCGGAMQESRCNECGARIGGSQHRLLQDNQLAREMDGARHAAWSEQANMANYGRLF